jgi:NDP-mannose synthase
MKAVILAGGLGARLHPLTKIIPKPLLPIGEKAILEIQIDRLREYGFDHIFLATNYKSSYIEKFFQGNMPEGVRLKIVKEEKPLGTAGPITLLKDELTEPFLLMNGDILTLIDFSKFYQHALGKGCCLTLALKRHILPFDFGNVFFDGDFVTGLEEKKDIVSHILAGMYILTPDIFQHIPEDTYFGMDHLIHSLLKGQVPIAKYIMEEYWLDVGQIEDLAKAEEEFYANLGEQS